MRTVQASTIGSSAHDAFSLLVRHWPLTWTMAKREITDRYAGQMLGVLWAFGHPLVLMGVYLFVFGFVFQTRMGDASQMPSDYVVYLLSGLIPWLAMNECLNKACITITGNSNLVKQVVFPLEILPVKTILATLFSQGICLALLTGYVLATTSFSRWTVLLLPGVIACQILFMGGIGFLLSSVGPYVRDLKDVVQVFSVIGVYLIPVVYVPEMVPGIVRPLLYANPFSHLIWCYQDIYYFGYLAHPWSWLVLPLFSLISCALSFRIFQKLKPYFGNVL